MKLYTEEQVNQAMLLYIQEIPRETIFKEHLTPIELPTDEEIEIKAKDYADSIGNKNGTAIFDFIQSCKWYKEQLKK